MKATVLLILFFLCAGFFADAQKLPNKQETGVYAPANVKIDGSAKEWSENFSAYNHATEIYYTMANDADNLYLVFKATEAAVIQKIVTGGLSLSVSPVEKKTDMPPVTMTYPVVPFLFSQVNYALKPAAPLSDSQVMAINRKINDHLKEIKITGIKSIPDSSVSIYNDLGIKGAQHVDNQKAYTCEVVLPLKFVRQMINSQGTFAYRVQVTGIDLKTTKIISGRATDAPPAPSDSAVPHGMEYDISPTYFSALYTLAKP